MRISEAAIASNCHLETVRYYERIGLLAAPPRNASGYRNYRDEDIARLQFISRGRALGFSIEEIRSLLRLSKEVALSCAEVDKIARQHLNAVRGKIRDLQRMARELEHTIEQCQEDNCGNCTILDALKHP